MFLWRWGWCPRSPERTHYTQQGEYMQVGLGASRDLLYLLFTWQLNASVGSLGFVVKARRSPVGLFQGFASCCSERTAAFSRGNDETKSQKAHDCVNAAYSLEALHFYCK